MKKQALSGSDYFHLLLDRKMLRNGLVGNISRIHLELEPDTDLEAIQRQLLANETLREVSRLQVIQRWPLHPIWVHKKETPTNVEIRTGLTKSEFDSSVLNRKVSNNKSLVFIDLCTLEDNTNHVAVSMHHVLFDHQGMINFIQALAGDSSTFPIFPDKKKTSFLQTIWHAAYMTAYMLRRSSGKLGSLVEKNLKPKSTPHFKVIEFSEQETELIESNAWLAGARIGKSPFYISATAQVVYQVLRNRNENPPYLWFSVPNDQRRKGTAGHLVSNQLSFLFFRLQSNELKTSKASVDGINQQLKAQIKNRITQRYTNLLSVLRLTPMPIYEAMVDLASNGKMSSFGFSDLGTDKLNSKKFLGAQVQQTHHYPPVPSPPGFNAVVSKTDGKLKFVWAYFDEVLNESEVKTMEEIFRQLLLLPASE